MTVEQEVVLALVRMAVSGKAVSLAQDVEWAKVMVVALNQRVADVALEAVERLPDGQHPGPDNLMKWYGQLQFDKKDYSKHSRTLKELVRLLGQNNIKVLLLKGLGLGKYYPIPSHRPCGDIDIYTYGKHDAVNEIVRSYGCDVCSDHEKHSVFYFKGISVENHRVYLNSFQTRHEGKVQEYLYTLSGDVLTEDGYYVPSPMKNYFFLLCHMSRHFSVSKCITLRHLLDWGYFLDGERDNLDTRLAQEKLREFNLVQSNDIFTSLAQDVTGYDLSMFITDKVDAVVKIRFLEAILAERNPDVPSRLIPRIVYKSRLLLGNMWKYKYLGFTLRECIWWYVKAYLSGRRKI